MTTAYKVWLTVTLVILFISCKKEEQDEVIDNCNEPCLEIKGRFTVGDSTQPLSNQSVRAVWYIGDITKEGVLKGATRTNSSGFYSMKMNLSEQEVNTGTLEFEFEIDTSIYTLCFPPLHFPHTNKIMGAVHNPTNDTTIEMNFNLPYKGYLNIHAIGTEKMTDNDFIRVEISNPYCTYSGSGWIKSFTNYVYKYELPAEYPIVLETIIKKHNSESSTFDTVFIDKGGTSEYFAEFN